jgi:hypothetical protein
MIQPHPVVPTCDVQHPSNQTQASLRPRSHFLSHQTPSDFLHLPRRNHCLHRLQQHGRARPVRHGYARRNFVPHDAAANRGDSADRSIKSRQGREVRAELVWAGVSASGGHAVAGCCKYRSPYHLFEKR